MISFVDFRVVDFRVVMTAGRLDSLNFSGESNGYMYRPKCVSDHSQKYAVLEANSSQYSCSD